MPWLADLVESNEGSLAVLPVQCLCEFLLNDSLSETTQQEKNKQTGKKNKINKQNKTKTKKNPNKTKQKENKNKNGTVWPRLS